MSGNSNITKSAALQPDFMNGNEDAEAVFLNITEKYRKKARREAERWVIESLLKELYLSRKGS